LAFKNALVYSFWYFSYRGALWNDNHYAILARIAKYLSNLVVCLDQLDGRAVWVLKNNDRVDLIAACFLHELSLDQILDFFVSKCHRSVTKANGIYKVQDYRWVVAGFGGFFKINDGFRGKSQVVIVKDLSCR
jgi:hypothetical protein